MSSTDYLRKNTNRILVTSPEPYVQVTTIPNDSLKKKAFLEGIQMLMDNNMIRLVSPQQQGFEA